MFDFLCAAQPTFCAALNMCKNVNTDKVCCPTCHNSQGTLSLCTPMLRPVPTWGCAALTQQAFVYLNFCRTTAGSAAPSAPLQAKFAAAGSVFARQVWLPCLLPALRPTVMHISCQAVLSSFKAFTPIQHTRNCSSCRSHALA